MFIRDVLGCPNYASIPPNMVRTCFHPHQWLIVERSHDPRCEREAPETNASCFSRRGQGLRNESQIPACSPGSDHLEAASNVVTRLSHIMNSRVTSQSCRRRCRRESERSWTGCRTIEPSAPSSMWSSKLHKHLTFTHHTLLLRRPLVVVVPSSGAMASWCCLRDLEMCSNLLLTTEGVLLITQYIRIACFS